MFVDIDQSYTTPVADTVKTGYMVVRAPKGNTEGLYFAKGQANLIHSMIGIPTADWPDIQAAVDYNNQFGLWISAPPGSAAGYPSTFGGEYITKNGLSPFYNVTSLDSINYLSTVTVGSEMGFLSSSSNCIISPQLRTPGNAGTHDSIQITNISASFLPYVSKFLLKFWGNTGCVAYPDAKDYELYLDGTKIMVVPPESETAVQVGTVDSATQWTITGQTPLVTTNSLYIDFDQLVDIAPYLTSEGTAWISGGQAAYTALVTTALTSQLKWIVDVDDIAYLAIAQKSPTEKSTRVTISNIGYEKYYYDYSLSVYHFTVADANAAITINPTANECSNASQIFVAIKALANGTVLSTKIYKASNIAATDITNNYKTKYIKINAAPTDPVSPAHNVATSFVGKIYYVNSAGVMVECTAPTYKLDPTYNTVTFKVEEEVYPGKWVSGGTFTGSLDLAGTDTTGAKIYFKEILPDTADTFVIAEVRRTFESSLDPSTGLFTGTKVIDSREYGKSSSTINYIAGTRYLTHLVNDLISAGSLGGVLVNEETAILLDGWTEAASPTYDDVSVFMEPTGIESFKEVMYSLRAATHKLSNFIAPRKLTAAEVSDTSTIAVTGRLTGIAQPVNEFLRKDAYTGRKYWDSLIGAYGAKLTKIRQDKMGGWAPMWHDVSGLGGQLNISVEKEKYHFDPDTLSELDVLGLNPMVLDPSAGVMVVSQKTTQDPTNVTDWSYLGHQMAFDELRREIRDGVMHPQIGKPNDTFYQALRQRQAETILARRTGGLSPIWAAGKVEVANVNTEDIKAQRSFKIKISVKVNVFSEYVILEFVNVSQSTSF